MDGTGRFAPGPPLIGSSVLGGFAHVMPKVTTLTGPVENIDGKLFLRIPLDAGGSELVTASRGIGIVEGDFLSIEIMDWLAKKLGISEGSLVTVDNANGKFNIRPSEPSV